MINVPLNKSIFTSTDKALLDVVSIHHYISTQSYWGAGRTLQDVKTSIDHSMCFGVYSGTQQVAFARVVTDTVTFAYLQDVLVFPIYQKSGYSKVLLNSIFDHPQLQTVNWLLRTADAQGLYAKYGFSSQEATTNLMSKKRVVET